MTGPGHSRRDVTVGFQGRPGITIRRTDVMGQSRHAPTTPWEIWSKSGPKVNRLALPQACVAEIAKRIDDGPCSLTVAMIVTVPLLHQRGDMPRPTITSSGNRRRALTEAVSPPRCRADAALAAGTPVVFNALATTPTGQSSATCSAPPIRLMCIPM